MCLCCPLSQEDDRAELVLDVVDDGVVAVEIAVEPSGEVAGLAVGQD